MASFFRGFRRVPTILREFRPLVVSAALVAVGIPSLSSGGARCDTGCCGSDQAIESTHALSAAPSLPSKDRETAVRRLLDALRVIFDVEQLVTTDVELEPFGRDQHSYHSGAAPDVVVFPSSTVEVSRLLQLCSTLRVPVVARGAGTSLEGHTTCPSRGVVVDFSRMDAVLAVRPEDMDATVQAGVRWQDLNDALKPHGLFFAMDPGPGATVGGMVGTGCSGTNAFRYGTMKANVVSLTVVLADGTVVHTGSRARKSSAGYDLTSLFVGSEGTLGLVTEATLRLHPLPQATAVAVCAFPSVRAASDAVLAVARAGVQAGAMELLDAAVVAAVNAQVGCSLAPVPHLLFKFTGSSTKVADDAAQAQARVAAHGGTSFAWTTDAAGQARLWGARKEALWSVAASDPRRRVATTDVCVPLSRLPDLMAAMEARCARSTLAVSAVGHAGDGNAHHFILFDPDSAAEMAEARSLVAFLVHTAQGMDGTCTGEHGVGVGKTQYLAAEYGEAGVALMRAIKAALDPAGILNPGKKLPRASGAGCAAPSASVEHDGQPTISTTGVAPTRRRGN